MPTYEYECTKCGDVFELFQSIKDKPKRTIATNCTECSNKAPVIRRIGTGAAVLFKGSGFYQTDYRPESYKEAAKKETEAATPSTDKKSDSKTETKAEAKTTETSKPTEAKPASSVKSKKSSKPK